MKQLVKSRLAALAVVGSLALGGAVMAAPAPAQAGAYGQCKEKRVVGVYHWRCGTTKKIQNHTLVNDYNWSDMLDKSTKYHRTGVSAHWASDGWRVNKQWSDWTAKGVWSKKWAAAHPNGADNDHYREWKN